MKNSARYAAAGARIVAWPEGSGLVRDADEPALLAEMSATARSNAIYLFASYIVWHPGQTKSLENKVVAIGPNGHLDWAFHKGHPIVGFETARVAPGDNAIRLLDTPYGRIGVAICHDLDFPDYVAAAGRAHVDLFVDPSNDWPAIGWLHANMHRYRAIENGFILFRPTDHGASMVADATGNVRIWTSTYRNESGLFLFEAPSRHVLTMYAMIGDWLVWVCAIVLLLFLLKAVLDLSRSAHKATPLP